MLSILMSGRYCPVAVVLKASESKLSAVCRQSRMEYVEGAFGKVSIGARANSRPASAQASDANAAPMVAAATKQARSHAPRRTTNFSRKEAEPLDTCTTLEVSATKLPGE